MSEAEVLAGVDAAAKIADCEIRISKDRPRRERFESSMSHSGRAARQILRDLQWAGLTHLPLAERSEVPAASPSPVMNASPSGAAASVENAPSRAASTELASPPVAGPSLEWDRSAPLDAQLSEVAACVAQCVRCPELARTRKQTVFGVGDPKARVMFIGEAPGADEDRQGEPFVGKAGQLLNRIVEACGWKREELYICNVLRCRPPGNRTPNEEEAANCREYLDAQIAIVNPEYIVCWGACAAQNLLGTKDSVGRMRQRFLQHGRAKVMVTYHPSYLLRNPSMKKPVWDDMKFLLADMGQTPPTP